MARRTIILILIFLSTLSNAQKRPSWLPAKTIAYFPFTSNLMDYLGVNKMATPNNQIATCGFGWRGLYFDGVDDYCLVSTNLSLLQFVDGQTFSFAAWIWPTNNATGIIFANNKAASPGNGYAVYMVSGASNPYLEYAKSGVANTGQTQSTTPLTINTWNHIAVTVQFAGSSGVIKFYINGVLKATKTAWSSNPVSSDYTQGIQIGRSIADGNLYYKGWMKHLIWTTGLMTNEEIKRCMLNTR